MGVSKIECYIVDTFGFLIGYQPTVIATLGQKGMRCSDRHNSFVGLIGLISPIGLIGPISLIELIGCKDTQKFLLGQIEYKK